MKRSARRGAAIFPLALMIAAAPSAAETLSLPMQAHEGYFVESCIALTQGQRLSYEIDVPHAVDFNLHHHKTDGTTIFPDRGRVSGGHSYELAAESAGPYCFMATNPASRAQAYELTVHYEISGG